MLTPQGELEELRQSIADTGWGRRFLDLRDDATGTWGNGMYSPKWVSTHYTLLDLKNIGLPPTNLQYRESSKILLDAMWRNHGLAGKNQYQDLCVSAMALDICCYAGIQSDSLFEIVDYILARRYPDGGWNCNWDHGDLHSSLHTTLTVLEAIRDYEAGQYTYRLGELAACIPAAQEFILRKQLYKSVHDGGIIDKKMLMLSFPCRWKFDILRCLDYFQSVGKEPDGRMGCALGIVMDKKRRNNRWPLQQKYVGRVHFDMEETGQDSRWNTLRVLRVLKKYNQEAYEALTVAGDISC